MPYLTAVITSNPTYHLEIIMKKLSMFVIFTTISSIISQETNSEKIINGFTQRRLARIEILKEREKQKINRLSSSVEAYNNCVGKYKEQTLNGQNPNYDCSEKLAEIEKPNLRAAKHATKQAIFGNFEDEKKLEALISERIENRVKPIEQNIKEYEYEKDRILNLERTFRNCNENYKAEYAEGKKPLFFCANKFIETTGISLLGSKVYKADESSEIRKLKREL